MSYKKAHPKRHLACAIVSTVLFFATGNRARCVSRQYVSNARVRSGLVAVFYAVKALHCERNGYYEQALIHSRRSLSWSLATYVIALFVYLALGLIVFIRSIDHH